MFYTNFGAIISLMVYISVFSLMTSYLRIVFLKDPNYINSNESNSVADYQNFNESDSD